METQKRKWSIQTQHTRSIGARLPNELYERLKSFCAQHGYTTTEAVCESLVKFMDSFEDSGKEDGGYFLY
jgi:predicted DNA-binding protein